MGATFQTTLPQGMFRYVVGGALPGIISVAFIIMIVALGTLAVHGSRSAYRSIRHRRSA